MSKLIYIINGPNLNLLGERETNIYGHVSLSEIEEECTKLCNSLKLKLLFLQSNAEYQIIDWIHEARNNGSAIIINAAAFSHTSIAILDALNTFDRKVIEVHLSDISKREEFRQFSFISLRADKIFMGEGLNSYLKAIRSLC